eukprot:gene18068-23715_t
MIELLPESFTRLKSLTNLDISKNKLVSLPDEIIQKYLKYRQIRLEELEELLELEDFVFIRGHTKPYAYEVLDDGLGFLTPEDLIEFDLAIDEYINHEYFKCPATAEEIVKGITVLREERENGFLTPEDLIEFDLAIDEYINHEYFKCPATAEEIVKGITVLREERENGLYLSILETFIGVLDQLLKEQQLADSENNDHKDHKRRRDKSKNIIYPQSVLFEAQRPWGRQGEQCGVFVVSLQSLLKDLAPNRLTPTGRPSILSHLIEALPLMPFPFTIELLKDCLRLYLSPYGQVADTERVIFPYCDCFNERTNKPVNHVRCEKPAVVIVKTIYRDDEAMMRDIEEDEYMIQFEAIDNDIQLWLNTDEGKKQLDKEVTKRRAHSLENLRLREEMVVIEGLKLINAQNNLKKLQKRKYQMENSAPFEVHQFLDMDDAIKQIAVEENKIVRCANREDALKQLIVKLKEELKLELKDRRIAAIDDITEKYCALNYQNTVHICRKYAYKHNLRRPWDGLEGSAYNDWLRGYVDNPDNTTDLPLDKQLEIESERENKLDYNWDNTNNMEKFKTELYETPSNPQCKITDIKSISNIARSIINQNDLCIVVDSTWSTPYLLNPLTLGADIVMHSTTKYIGGHSDLLGGVLVVGDTIGGRSILPKLKTCHQIGGGVASPFDSWLALRGLRTLPVRMKQHSDNALIIAKQLNDHKDITKVYYPGLPSHPQHQLASQQMRLYGGMMSFLVNNDRSNGGSVEALNVVKNVKLFKRATSLGGTESLIEHRRTAEGLFAVSPPNLLRISVGLEDPYDLIDDLFEAISISK